MSSFDKMTVWPIGYFRATTSWLLRNRKEVSARISTMSAEIARIGHLTIGYEKTTDAEGVTTVSETRISISVTPGSTIQRLVQAYIANGGNPLDISPFAHATDDYPHGGVVSPQSSDAGTRQPVMLPADGDNDPVDSGFGAYMGGWLNTDRYYASRQGGRKDSGSYDSDTIVVGMHQIRSWANQEIKERLQDIEWRIIKQCDLREQLIKERDEVLVQAFGQYLEGVAHMDEGRFDDNLLVQNIIQDMYQLIYQDTESGAAKFSASELLPLYGFALEDANSEINRFEMGC